jgi:hypothetical protein
LLPQVKRRFLAPPQPLLLLLLLLHTVNTQLNCLLPACRLLSASCSWRKPHLTLLQMTRPP